ncbi:MAG: hypothetical protein MI923_12950 [Phycisphaerales bacterium]|nr:hypothetical protein [Phycisphaerales bacterium]
MDGADWHRCSSVYGCTALSGDRGAGRWGRRKRGWFEWFNTYASSDAPIGSPLALFVQVATNRSVAHRLTRAPIRSVAALGHLVCKPPGRDQTGTWQDECFSKHYEASRVQ